MSRERAPRSRVVVPRPPKDLDPLVDTWPPDREIHRVYDVAWGPREFYAGDARHRARFSPFNPGRRRTPVPVLYGADSLAGALSETVFHDVPRRGRTRTVAWSKLHHRIAIRLRSTRDLRLADLSGAGLSRIRVERTELLDAGSQHYPETAHWAKAIHDHPGGFDGMVWVSRQLDTSLAIVLFGDRVGNEELVVADGVPLTLGAGKGFDEVAMLAADMGIVITGLLE